MKRGRGAKSKVSRKDKGMSDELKEKYDLGILRIFLGAIFFWAFIDKTFGLGFATSAEKAWISGGSPTYGFLSNATKGPFASFFQSLAGNVFVDWIFMIGLLGIGLALIFGVLVKIASVSGAVMMFLMWAAALPPQNNPFLDDHIIYLVVFIAFLFAHVGKKFGFGKWWCRKPIVKRFPWLE